jgi:Xaa-Pro aminopeptidase
VSSEAQPELQNEEGKVFFEPGMMFACEMVVELPGSTPMPDFNVEDDVVVTETSVQNVNATLRRDFRVKL